MISLLEHADENALQRHLVRHHAESAAARPPFMAAQDFDLLSATYAPADWQAPTNWAGWQRCWGYREGGELRAHVVVTGNPLAMHRCTLGMHVEQSWRRKGIGRRLMWSAVAWLRQQDALRWVDGFAMESNHAVLALDYEVGFRELGRIPDALRWLDQAGVERSETQLVLAIDLQEQA